MAMTITQADAAMKVIRHVLDPEWMGRNPTQIPDEVKVALKSLRDGAHKVLLAGITDTELARALWPDE